MTAAALEQRRVRSDLRVSEQIEGKLTFVVKEPVTGRFFRFGLTEHFIVQQLDGATSFDALRQRFETKFGTALSAESVGQFVATLSRLGLLETQGRAAGDRIERRRVFRGSLLSTSLSRESLISLRPQRGRSVVAG